MIRGSNAIFGANTIYAPKVRYRPPRPHDTADAMEWWASVLVFSSLFLTFLLMRGLL